MDTAPKPNLTELRTPSAEVVSLPELKNFNIPIPEVFVENKNVKVERVVFNGISLDLRISTTNFSEKPIKPFAMIVAVLKEEKEGVENRVASLYLVLEKVKNELKVTMAVSNEDRELKGLGRALFTTSLKLVQDIADKWNLPVTHFLRKEPHFSLTREKWDEIFLPILESNQYKQDSEDSDLWEKTYLPSNR